MVDKTAEGGFRRESEARAPAGRGAEPRVNALPWLKGLRAHAFEGSNRGAQRRQTHKVRREAVRSEANEPRTAEPADRWSRVAATRQRSCRSIHPSLGGCIGARIEYTERWLSGRKRSPAKGVRANTPSRVRIPLSPPHIFKTALLNNAPVAQLDRVLGYEPSGREFESLRARHLTRA